MHNEKLHLWFKILIRHMQKKRAGSRKKTLFLSAYCCSKHGRKAAYVKSASIRQDSLRSQNKIFTIDINISKSTEMITLTYSTLFLLCLLTKDVYKFGCFGWKLALCIRDKIVRKFYD